MILLVLFVCVAVASIVSSFWLLNGDLPLLLVKTGGYWLLLFAFAVFAYAVFKVRRYYFHGLADFFSSFRWPILACVGIVGLYFCISEPWFKVTMDEVVLASTSMHMHIEKEVFTASRGYEVNGVFYLLGGYLDKRPYFFAFLVSLVHDLFGYRAENVFFFNAAVSVAFLFFVYLAGTQFGSRRWGWMALVTFAGIPLVGVNITGGGFEIFNLLMILVTCFLGKLWLDNPGDASLVAFTYSGLLLAQCRYESILFVLPVGLVILFGWWKEQKIRLPWPLLLAPVVLIPYVLQNRVLNESKVLWQLQDDQPSPFGMQYLEQNLKSALDYFTQRGLEQGNSLFFLLFLLIGVCLLIVYLFRNRDQFSGASHAWRTVAWLFGATVVINFTLLMFYYWGQINDPVATRLSLPLHLALLFCVIWISSRELWNQVVFKLMLPVGIVCFWFLTIPNVAQSLYLRFAYEAREVDWMRSVIDDQEGPLLVVSNQHLAAIVEGVSAIPVGYATTRKTELAFHMASQTFSQVLVFNRELSSISAEERSFSKVQIDQLKEHFEIERVADYRLGPDAVAYAHRVVSVLLNDEELKVYEARMEELEVASNQPGEDLTKYFSKWLP